MTYCRHVSRSGYLCRLSWGVVVMRGAVAAVSLLPESVVLHSGRVVDNCCCCRVMLIKVIWLLCRGVDLLTSWGCRVWPHIALCTRIDNLLPIRTNLLLLFRLHQHLLRVNPQNTSDTLATLTGLPIILVDPLLP